ncbi:MAG TPA: NAD(P)H-dependent oxidoreductase subunit E [Anaerolineae bacterium]|nr:NAD(P)H-dependent oxidoreductase subunit E [Caldilineae bacterium]HID33662.1 NAD(P)H-dependent oxidoreductase subunit E [Anaerolineae bacterium]HIQ11707.1 NAD(P)H-dependent oxidoreductase subunit E [Caldilineales bacterium]
MAIALDDHIDLSPMEEIFEAFQGQQGALIPILQKTQAIYGWLPPQSLELIAHRLNLSTSKVYGVATFYAQFYLKPRGRHVLKLCDGTACHVKGTPILATAVEEEYHIRVGETTEDGELTVEIVYCIGSCALAPVAILDDEVMGRVKQDKLIRTLRRKLSPATKTTQGKTT